MGKYLKKFNTHTEYETYINGSDKVLPNVSLCATENEVHYNPVEASSTIVKYDIGSGKNTYFIGDFKGTKASVYTNENTQGCYVLTGDGRIVANTGLFSENLINDIITAYIAQGIQINEVISTNINLQIGDIYPNFDTLEEIVVVD